MTFRTLVSLALYTATVWAHGNGMDMSMDGPMNLASGSMVPYLHFTPGDILWFLGWVPKSTGAMVGTCIGLFLLALVERWIAAVRRVMEVHWRSSALRTAPIRLSEETADAFPTNEKKTKLRYSVDSDIRADDTPIQPQAQAQDPPTTSSRRRVPPFLASRDVTRGIIHLVQTALGFLFMLTVMSFQASFIIAICVGLGVGETLFGRFGDVGHGGIDH
ncbi:hypothetical protein ONZ45_g3346 [Pleurotus djamor]|nr:hypothetical protein ONZ45_g3346 [Pleurotus djamor]